MADSLAELEIRLSAVERFIEKQGGGEELHKARRELDRAKQREAKGEAGGDDEANSGKGSASKPTGKRGKKKDAEGDASATGNSAE